MLACTAIELDAPSYRAAHHYRFRNTRNRFCAIYALRAMHGLLGHPVDFTDRAERTIFVFAAVALGGDMQPMIRVSAGEGEAHYKTDWPKRLRKQLREMPQSVRDLIAFVAHRALLLEAGVYARRQFGATFLE